MANKITCCTQWLLFFVLITEFRIYAGETQLMKLVMESPLPLTKIQKDLEYRSRSSIFSTIVRSDDTRSPLVKYLNEQDKLGNTALISASSRSDSLPIVKLLVESGADVNLVKSSKQGAILFAAAKRNFDTVEYLLGKNADPNLKDNSQVSAFDILKGAKTDLSKYPRIYALLNNPQLTQCNPKFGQLEKNISDVKTILEKTRIPSEALQIYDSEPKIKSKTRADCEREILNRIENFDEAHCKSSPDFYKNGQLNKEGVTAVLTEWEKYNLDDHNRRIGDILFNVSFGGGGLTLICNESGSLVSAMIVDPYGSEALYLSELVSHPDRNKFQGGGKAAVDLLIKRAIRNNMKSITLEPGYQRSSNRSPFRFYEFLGFSSGGEGQIMRDDKMKEKLFKQCKELQP